MSVLVPYHRHDRPGFVGGTAGTNEKPAIHAIMAAKPRLDLAWFT
jgi:hypothetical protein